MIRIGAVAVVVLLVCTLIGFGSQTGSPEKPWAPSQGHIGSNDGSLYYFKLPDRTVVFYFPGDFNSTSRSSQNLRAKTFSIDVTLEGKGIVPIALKGESSRMDVLEVNGKSYRLAAGEVFRVSAKGDVVQLPFRPLEPTQEYLEMLKRHFSTTEGQHGGIR
jgi:hypothetical protein